MELNYIACPSVGVRLGIFSFFIRIICLSREWCGRYNLFLYRGLGGWGFDDGIIWGYTCLQAVYTIQQMSMRKIYGHIDSDKVLTSKLGTTTNHVVIFGLVSFAGIFMVWRVNLILNSMCNCVFDQRDASGNICTPLASHPPLLLSTINYDTTRVCMLW